MPDNPSPNINAAHSWKRVSQHGLFKEIKCLRDYDLQCERGLVLAAQYLRSFDLLQDLNVELIQNCHKLIFAKVYPWAGSFRTKSVSVGRYLAADHQCIRDELELAIGQFRQMLSDPAYGELAALAFFHLRYERTHPFLDGNGRSGRAILIEQFSQAFSSRSVLPERAHYLEAMQEGFKGNLSPLMQLLARGLGEEPGIPGQLKSPFRVVPSYYGESIWKLAPAKRVEASRLPR